MDPPTVGSISQARGSDPLELPSHLHDLYQRASSELSTEDAGKLAEVLGHYGDVFAWDDMDLGCFSAVRHRIETGNARPI